MTTDASLSDTHLQGRRRLKRVHAKVRTGCITCRRRRVKCDETKPSCNQCVKRSLTCEGYEQIRIWLFQKSTQDGEHNRDSKRKTTSDGARSTEATIVRNQQSITKSITSTIASRNGLLNYLVARWLPTTIPTIVPLGSWCLVAKDLTDASTHEVLTQAMLTFSVALMSILESDTRLQVGAIRGYQQVLAVLRSRIEGDQYKSRLKSDHRFLSSLAASGFACAMIEYMLQTWLRSDQHLSGIEMMFRACGPTVLDDPVNRQIFFDHRMIWICCDFMHRKTSCYSTREWQEFSWSQSDPIYNSPIHRFFTLASNVPPIINQYDKVKNSATLNVHARFYLKFKHHIDLFEKWKVEAIASGQLELPASLQHSDHVFPLHLVYSSTDVTMTHMYHSALKIFVLLETLESGKRIQRWTKDETEDFVSTDRVRFLSLCEAEVLNICQSIKPLMSSHDGVVKMPCSIFFIDTAWQGFAMLEGEAGYDLTAIRVWFNDLGESVMKQGFQMMRQPWKVAVEACHFTDDLVTRVDL